MKRFLILACSVASLSACCDWHHDHDRYAPSAGGNYDSNGNYRDSNHRNNDYDRDDNDRSNTNSRSNSNN